MGSVFQVDDPEFRVQLVAWRNSSSGVWKWTLASVLCMVKGCSNDDQSRSLYIYTFDASMLCESSLPLGYSASCYLRFTYRKVA